MLRDRNGEIIPFGKTARTLEETFLYRETLPDWMTLTGNGNANTYEIIKPSVEWGSLKVTTGANSGIYANIDLIPDGVDMSHCREIIISLDSLILSSNLLNFFIHLSNNAATNGASLGTNQNNGGETFVRSFTSAGVTKQKVVNYAITALNEQRRRKNISFRLRNDGTVILMEGDNVIAEYKFTSSEIVLNGIIHPRFTIENREQDVVKWLKTSRVAITVVHN